MAPAARAVRRAKPTTDGFGCPLKRLNANAKAAPIMNKPAPTIAALSKPAQTLDRNSDAAAPSKLEQLRKDYEKIEADKENQTVPFVPNFKPNYQQRMTDLRDIRKQYRAHRPSEQFIKQRVADQQAREASTLTQPSTSTSTAPRPAIIPKSTNLRGSWGLLSAPPTRRPTPPPEPAPKAGREKKHINSVYKFIGEKQPKMKKKDKILTA